MILNEIQTNRPWDRYESDPTPSPTPTIHTGGILLTLISMKPNVHGGNTNFAIFAGDRDGTA